MIATIRFLLWLFARSVVPLRYRVRYHGLDKIKELKGPILILPNHPAYMDPVIMLTWLFPVLRPRPLLFEGNFKSPFMKLVAKCLDALHVPDLEQTSVEARERTQQAIEGVKDALREGQNVILWPSGHLQRVGIERLGAARTLSDVLRDVPEAKVVLMRTRGLWGSRFSYGFDGTRPPLGKRFLQGAGYLLANLIFFAPRREVNITVEYIERSRLPELEREKLNPWLEKWYNADPEKPTFVPAHFYFGPRTHDFPAFKEAESVDLSGLKPETRHAVVELLTARLNRPLSESEVADNTSLESIGLDSLDRMELSLQVERTFGFTADQVPATMAHLYALAGGLLTREPPAPPKPIWFVPPSTVEASILAETIPQACVERALTCRGDVVCADDRSGTITYERLLVGALVMAKQFRKLPGDHIGLLLPSSVACDLALLGIYLAGKTPVILNWTTGPANLAHAAGLVNLQYVITSKLFVDRTGIKVNGTNYLFLEEVRQQISKFKLLTTLLKVRYLPGRVRRQTPTPAPDSVAVVLFTSGSEKAPKAVPLTHRNILSNQRSGIPTLKVDRRDSIIGFLPAFHSFGLSITGLFPIMAGLRVVRHPDPTDAFALARKIGLYRPTILVGTPTFVSYILDRAEDNELVSIRLVIVGAEKCPKVLFDRLAQIAPNATVIEGYGITECSPVVSVNPPDASRPGTVGKPLPGVEICVVDLDSDQKLGPNERGMLLVSGPTIFPGYLGTETPSPFRVIDGKRWYVTGDLVEVDDDGYIHFSGRLKRFIKAGGEMISLPALEEPFVRLHPPTKDGPRVAVEGVELEGGGRRIVLFTTEAIALRDANDILQKEGFHGVMRLDEVRFMEELPVLGTGKTDYKVLRADILKKLTVPGHDGTNGVNVAVSSKGEKSRGSTP